MEEKKTVVGAIICRCFTNGHKDPTADSELLFIIM